MKARRFVAFFSLLLLIAARAQQAYSGPRPPKKDLVYLLQAQRLIETEVQQASESKSKEGQVVSVPGTTSTARTPLPEPIFLFSPGAIRADRLVLYRFEATNGRREVVISKRKAEDDEHDLRVTLRKLDESLYRIEASHMLEPGEYALLPQSSTIAFCFTVY
jgi:hypothetical protein